MAAVSVAVVCNIAERTGQDTAGSCTRTVVAVGQRTVVAGHIAGRTDPWGRE